MEKIINKQINKTMTEEQHRLHKTASLIAASIVGNKEAKDYAIAQVSHYELECEEQSIAKYSYQLALFLIDEGRKDICQL